MDDLFFSPREFVFDYLPFLITQISGVFFIQTLILAQYFYCCFVFRHPLRGDNRVEWLKIGSGKLKAKTWHHLAGIFDGKNLKFILDGKLIGSTAIKLAAKDTYIGAHPNPTNWWNGMIDEVAVFDAVLAEEEINHIITRGLENWQPVDLSEKMATRWAKIKSTQ